MSASHARGAQSGGGEHRRRDALDEVFDAVLFDNDSTLTDSKASVECSWVQWAQGYGLALDRLTDTHGMPSRQIITRIAPELEVDEATAAFGRIELENLGDVSTVPGALQALQSVGDRAAIVTSAGRVLLEKRLEAAGIPNIRVTVTADDVSRGKPAPDPYLEGARRLGADPRKCLVVEDAVAGIQSAKAAGAATLAVLTTTPADQLREADLVVNDLSDVRFRAVDGGRRVALNQRA